MTFAFCYLRLAYKNQPQRTVGKEPMKFLECASTSQTASIPNMAIHNVRRGCSATAVVSSIEKLICSIKREEIVSPTACRFTRTSSCSANSSSPALFTPVGVTDPLLVSLTSPPRALPFQFPRFAFNTGVHFSPTLSLPQPPHQRNLLGLTPAFQHFVPNLSPFLSLFLSHPKPEVGQPSPHQNSLPKSSTASLSLAPPYLLHFLHPLDCSSKVPFLLLFVSHYLYCFHFLGPLIPDLKSDRQGPLPMTSLGAETLFLVYRYQQYALP